MTTTLPFSAQNTSFPIPVWLIALIFGFPVVVGLLIFLQRLLTRKLRTQGTDEPNRMSGGCLFGFAGIFVLAGLATFYFAILRPTLRAHQAERWPTTQGVVISSRLETHHDSDGGNTYRVDIHYRYTVDGREHESNQYDGTGTHSTEGWGREHKQAVVAAHRPGTPVTVHYDPADPDDAMLSTAVPPGTWAFVWFPILFCTFPVAIVYGIYRSQKNAGKPGTAKPVAIAPTAADARRKRRTNFLGILLFALFWNGFVTFFWLMTHTWCIAPFAVIGVLIALMAAQQGLAMFNPLVSVSFSRMPLHPGDTCDVAFTVDGNVLAIQSLSFKLVGREKVTYTQGTTTRTENKDVYVFPLMETTKSFEMERGRFTIKLPADVMTSFQAKNNGFSWHLVCHGQIARRPDIKDEFDVTVLNKAVR